MNDGNARQQIVESIKKFSNILVTVSTNPSVDELSAALGLTIMLNNLDKRATAVVSGNVPPAITFLDPEKTFENSVNSLRDFIIALDKEKADHLRYKVDGDVVKIFITPYRTTLGQEDLEFSQGDYNVELVIALGVKDQDHLDKALAAHGRIFHDATVATISTDNEPSTLGSIDWRDPASSSLSEMLVSLSDALKDDTPVLDEQIATAFLTGIVSATDRFSNGRTSSRVMTMAAQLMAAGANQQLIAAKLEAAHDIGPQKPQAAAPSAPADDGAAAAEAPKDDSLLDLAKDKPARVGNRRKKANNKVITPLAAEPTTVTQAPEVTPEIAPLAAAAQDMAANPSETLEAVLAGDAAAVAEVTPTNNQSPEAAPVPTEVTEPVSTPEVAAEPVSAPEAPTVPSVAEVPTPEVVAEQDLARQLAGLSAPDATDSLEALKQELTAEVPTPAAPAPAAGTLPATPPSPDVTPVAASSLDGMPDFEPIDVPVPVTPPAVSPSISGHPHGGYVAPEVQPTEEPTGIVEEGIKPGSGFASSDIKTIDPFSAPLPPLPDMPTTSPLDQQVFNDLDNQPPVPPVAEPATETAQPAPQPPVAPAVELPPLPPLPDFSTLPLPPTPPTDASTSFPQGGAVSSDQLGDIFGTPDTNVPPAAPPPPTPPTPGQYRIPGQ